MLSASYLQIRFSDVDVVNPDGWSYNAGCQRHKPYLIHDHGFTLAVVFAADAGEALDIAADAGRLDAYRDVVADEDSAWDRLVCLGNASNFYNLETLCTLELPDVRFSFATLFMSQHAG